MHKANWLYKSDGMVWLGWGDVVMRGRPRLVLQSCLSLLCVGMGCIKKKKVQKSFKRTKWGKHIIEIHLSGHKSHQLGSEKRHSNLAWKMVSLTYRLGILLWGQSVQKTLAGQGRSLAYFYHFEFYFSKRGFEGGTYPITHWEEARENHWKCFQWRRQKDWCLYSKPYLWPGSVDSLPCWSKRIGVCWGSVSSE